jgi:hypothetical protein
MLPLPSEEGWGEGYDLIALFPLTLPLSQTEKEPWEGGRGTLQFLDGDVRIRIDTDL